MRILELYLKAYGPFTDRVLDFSRGCEGLHIVFGPNEAGKSSALRAVSAFLFGIHGQTKDDFVHDYKDLRIGARLADAAGKEVVLWRRKGNKATLRDRDDDAPVEEDVLQALLGGINVSVFEEAFGIDHERLVEGGQVLLAGEGAVGESLFAAGLGSAKLRELLSEIDQECDALFKGRASKPKINTLVREYRGHVRSAKEASLASAEWTGHRKALEQARAEHERSNRAYEEGRADLSRHERLARALPKLAQRDALLERLAALETGGPLPALRKGFEDERRKAANERDRSQDRQATAATEVARLQAVLKELKVPADLLARQTEIDGLHQDIATHRTAASDRIGLVAKQQRVEAEAADHLLALYPGADAEARRDPQLSVVQRKTIQALADRHGQLVATQAAARKAQEKSARAFEKLTRDLEDAAAPVDAAALKSLCRRARQAGDLEARATDLRVEAGANRQGAEADLKSLGLWQGPLSDVESLPLPPPATIDRFETVWDEIRERTKDVSARIRDCEEQLRLFDSQLAEVERQGTVPTAEELTAARNRRQDGWQLVRRAWLAGEEVDEQAYDPERKLPEAYEHAVDHADDVADDLRADADRVATKAQLLARCDEQRARAERLEEERRSLQQELSVLEAEWRDSWSEVDLEPRTPREMRAWLGSHERLVEQVRALRKTDTVLATLESEIEDHRAALLGELRRLGDDEAETRLDTLTRLLDHAESRVADAERARSALDEMTKRRGDSEAGHADASTDLERATADLAAWETAWGEALAPLDMDAVTTPEAAREVLDVLSELTQARGKARGYAGRIDAIDRNAHLWRDQIAAIARDLAPDLTDADPEEAIRALHERCGEAAAAQRERDRVETELKQREADETKAKSAADDAIARLEALCREAGVESPEALPAVEERVREAERARARVGALDEELIEDGKGATLDELRTEAAGVDGDELDARLKTLENEVSELDKQRTEAGKAVGAAQITLASLEGTADAARHAEAAASAASQIQTESERYVRLTLARSILGREIERYRAANQGPLMECASGIFSKITCGSFAGLDSDYDESGEPILLAVRGGGERLPVAGMSDGTREQLYLALRLASLRRHLETGQPIPLIVDDILIRSDDQRSTAILAELAELSKMTQVLFFTHQDRQVALAEGLDRPTDVFLQRLE